MQDHHRIRTREQGKIEKYEYPQWGCQGSGEIVRDKTAVARMAVYDNLLLCLPCLEN